MLTHWNRLTALSSSHTAGRRQGAAISYSPLLDPAYAAHSPMRAAVSTATADCSGIIAAGADSSPRIALGRGSDISLSLNHGPLAEERNLLHYDDAMRLVARHFPPSTVVADSHPAMASSRVARAMATRIGAELVEVDHFHAHAVAAMAGHGLRGRVVAIVIDSADVSDATDSRRMRGSEILVCSETECTSAAHSDYITIPRNAEPWEAAVALIYHYAGSLRWIPDGLARAVGSRAIADVARRCDSTAESVSVSGGAMLWDAAAALIATEQGSPEGALAGRDTITQLSRGLLAAPYPLDSASRFSPAQPLEEMLTDLASHADPRVVAARFEATMARMWALGAARVASARGIRRVVASGDMLTDEVFARSLRAQLISLGLEPFIARAADAGDWAVAVGQTLVAASRRA